VKHIDAEPEILRRAIVQARDTMPMPQTPIDADEPDLTDNQYITLCVIYAKATLERLKPQQERYQKIVRLVSEEILELATENSEHVEDRLAS
jgi:hypothetical protein